MKYKRNEHAFSGLLPNYMGLMGSTGTELIVADYDAIRERAFSNSSENKPSKPEEKPEEEPEESGNTETTGSTKPYKSLRVVGETGENGDYLAEIEYEDYDWDACNDFMEENYTGGNLGACSSVRNGDWYGRNFDWYYDENEHFVVHVSAKEDRHASIGVAGSVSTLTREVVEGGIDDDGYKFLPFFTVDGINDAGLTANINVVSSEMGDTTGTTPFKAEREKICVINLVRYILDNFETAMSAATYIRDYVSVYAPVLGGHMQEIHVMMADAEKTIVLEFINNRTTIIDVTNNPVMTNFFLKDVERMADGTVDYLNSNLTDYAMGVERYNYAVSHYNGTDNHDGMVELMSEGLRYSKFYEAETNPFWYTEYVGWTATFGNLTCGDAATEEGRAKFDGIIAYCKNLWDTALANGRKDPAAAGCWITVHSVVYDMANKTMYLRTQEKDNEKVFTL